MGLFQVVVTDQAHVIVGVGFMAFRGLYLGSLFDAGFFKQTTMPISSPVMMSATSMKKELAALRKELNHLLFRLQPQYRAGEPSKPNRRDVGEAKNALSSASLANSLAIPIAETLI